jgi:hypothetical protein
MGAGAARSAMRGMFGISSLGVLIVVLDNELSAGQGRPVK